MTNTLKIFFSQKQIIFYLLFSFFGLYLSSLNGYILKFWYVSPLIIVLSPFIEYFIHKYFLHLPMPVEQEKKSLFSRFLRAIHYDHHQDPKNPEHIFAQLWLTFPFLALNLFFIYLLTGSFELSILIGSLISLYYLFYEWSHFVAHSSYTPTNRYGLYMKKYHLLHHYKNENYWYGITSPFADIVFGKFKKSEDVQKSPTAKNLSNRLIIEKE